MFWTSEQVFDPRDLWRLKGKTILVTGATAGLGREAVRQFARHEPHRIYLCGRNLEMIQRAAMEISQEVPSAPIRPLQLDLSSFSSVQEAAQTVLDESQSLHVLMLNAGIMFVATGQTQDSYEVQFGTNHMGHALLTRLL